MLRLIFTTLIAAAVAAPQFELRSDLVRHTLDGLARPGIKLQIINTMPTTEPLEPFERLQVDTGDARRLVDDLGDLRGAVAIKDESQALRFVRLLTSVDTWYIWRNGRYAAEVMSKEELKRVRPATKYSPNHDHGSSGVLGILSQDAWVASKLEPATINKMGGKYVVTRWLLVAAQDKVFSPHLEQVRETVDRNGRYQQEVLQKAAAPKLPDTRWMFLTFE